jgi:hypothetical protein
LNLTAKTVQPENVAHFDSLVQTSTFQSGQGGALLSFLQKITTTTIKRITKIKRTKPIDSIFQ